MNTGVPQIGNTDNIPGEFTSKLSLFVQLLAKLANYPDGILMMKYLKTSLAILFALFAFNSIAVLAQNGSKFTDPFVEYSFDIPDDRWKMTVKPTELNPSVEYVFVDRNDGHLAVRKTTAPQDALMSDIIREEEQKLQFMRGYVAGKEERFAGKLNGAIFNFEFVERGQGEWVITAVKPSGNATPNSHAGHN